MPDISPNLSLPFILPSQAQKHVTHNEAIFMLDALAQTVAATRDSTTPPGAPAMGECHIVPGGATGDWAGQTGAIAMFDGTGWRFLDPRVGWRAYVVAEAQGVVWTGTEWETDLAPLENLDGIGIGTSHDAVNRLAVVSEASLFSHDGTGHQIKVNKATATDTASLLFQTGWSGRAEMGTAGSDAFAIKVSADGSNWISALSFDPASGHVTGSAVQANAGDTTPGRLMRADYGYGPGNLLGAVSEAAGVPTGAVAERGSNANGEYVRFADGTQLCQHEATLDYVNGNVCSSNWTFPASFVPGSKPQILGSLSANSLLSSAPSVSPNGLTPLCIGALSTSSGALQVRTMAGTTFSSGEHVVVRVVAAGRWF